MKRFSLFIFLLLVSSVALADAKGVASLDTDLSMNFLGSIFGTVGGVLTGTSGQMLGKMFYIFNLGVLSVASAWLAMSVGQVVLRSAQEGSFLGQNKNVPVLMLRIAIGFALTIPAPGTGYSMSQVAVMQAVVGGVNLANHVWGAAVNYLSDGGEIYTSSFKKGSSTEKNLTDTAKHLFGDANSIGWQVFMSGVCMAHSNDEAEMQRQRTGDDGARQFYVMQPDAAKNTIGFPGASNVIPLMPGAQPSCGEYTGVGGDSKKESAKDASFSALYQLSEQLMPAAQRYADCKVEKKEYCGSDESTRMAIKTSVINAILSYYAAIQPYAQSQQKGNSSGHGLDGMIEKARAQRESQLRQALKKNAESSGWVMAGRYYWDLMQLNELFKPVNPAKFVPTAESPIEDSIFTAQNGVKDQVTRDIDKVYVSEVTKELDKHVDSEARASGRFKNKELTGGMPKIDGKGKKAAKALKQAMKAITNGIFPLAAQFKNVDGNPVLFLTELGQKCLSTAGILWAMGLAAMSLTAIAAGICASSQPGFLVLDMLNSWLKPVILGLCGVLLVPGIVLGYYLPLYPFMLFTFGVLSWLMIVLESMVAAPLVAFGITHPDNHDFLGKAEQGLMLLLSVFLRPALMIIGLISAIVVSYAILKIAILGFSGVLADIAGVSQKASAVNVYNIVESAGQKGMGGNALIWPVILISLLAIFSAFIFKIVQMTYSLIYELPNNIMRWIGAPGTTDNQSGEAARSVQGMASSSASQSGSGAMQGTMAAPGAGMGAASARNRAIQSQLEQKQKSGKGSETSEQKE